MSKAKDLKNKIERIPAFEDKMGIKLDNISIILNESFDESIMSVAGNILEVDKNKISSLGEYFVIETKVTVYDNDNDIVAVSTNALNVKDFLGFHTFEIYIGEIDTDNISKILIYPN